jgi:hypothetical protein
MRKWTRILLISALLLGALPRSQAQAPARLAPFSVAVARGAIEASKRDLESAFKADPQAGAAVVARDRTSLELQKLERLVNDLETLGGDRAIYAELKEITVTGAGTWRPDGVDRRSPGVKEALRSLGEHNTRWELFSDAVDPSKKFLFREPRMPLEPAQSLTIQAVRKARDRVHDMVTAPAALPFLEAIEAKIQEQARAWESFFQNVKLQEYPWESWANAVFDRKRTIDSVPTWQVKLGHPISGIVAYQGRSSSSGAPLIGGEVLGVQCFDPEADYKPTWGIGILATVRAEGERGNGLGLIASYREFKFGIRRSRLLDGRNVNQALISINLARYFDFKGDGALKQAIQGMKAWRAP